MNEMGEAFDRHRVIEKYIAVVGIIEISYLVDEYRWTDQINIGTVEIEYELTDWRHLAEGRI
jgi:hypothetical protein